MEAKTETGRHRLAPPPALPPTYSVGWKVTCGNCSAKKLTCCPVPEAISKQVGFSDAAAAASANGRAPSERWAGLLVAIRRRRGASCLARRGPPQPELAAGRRSGEAGEEWLPRRPPARARVLLPTTEGGSSEDDKLPRRKCSARLVSSTRWSPSSNMQRAGGRPTVKSSATRSTCHGTIPRGCNLR